MIFNDVSVFCLCGHVVVKKEDCTPSSCWQPSSSPFWNLPQLSLTCTEYWILIENCKNIAKQRVPRLAWYAYRGVQVKTSIFYCSADILNIEHTPWISTPGFPRYYCSDEILNIQHTPWILTPGFQSIPNLFTYYPPERIQMQSSLITLITLIRSEMDPKP